MINYREIELKWQAEWDKAKLFEGNLSTRDSYMVTAAFPYANAPQHIGHLRTFGTADVLARYKRMKGFNVLYPMGFHATGTPILAFAKRLQNKDQDLIHELKVFHVPDEEIAKMTDPVYIANYFIKEIEKGMHAAGYSIDWRRKMVSIEPIFSKMVEWQIGQLNSKGYLTKGKHPVGWCPNENNAVGMHDTKHDVEPEIDKETVVKFKIDGEEASLLCTTFRPETISGVTNLFVNENAAYILCTMDDKPEAYYIAKAAAESLKYQFSIHVVGEFTGKDLIKKTCINPFTKAKLAVFPGFFVKEGVGTGIVMSVPAHAPFDFVAIEKLKASGYTAAAEIKAIKVLDVPVGKSMGQKKGEEQPTPAEIPALAYLRLVNADINSPDDLIEQATKLAYKEESHWGKMTIQGYEGMSEPQARDRIKEALINQGSAFEIYVLTNSPVYCRCGYAIVVKVVDNQWFINYGNKDLKGEVRDAFVKVNVLPEKSRKVFESAIDWIDLRAVVRAQGLGTRFPLEKEKIIESLSDSTIYMSLYTIINLIRDTDPEKLKPEFFDYVFLGKGDLDTLAASTGIDYDVMRRSRETFEYWYKTTSRHSSPDLIFNHLTMYMYNHVAIFDKAYWPKQIVVNGTVLSEGEKMSKSLGNIVPLSDGIEQNGADPLRFVIIAGADLFSDSEYSADAVKGVKERLEYLYNITGELDSIETGALKHIDFWLYSKLNRKIDSVTKSMEILELRTASTEILYNSILELKRYNARGGSNEVVIRDYLSAVTLMLSPISPHISEELWHMLGNSTFASVEKWPSKNQEMISDKVDREEGIVDSVIEDARQVIGIVAKKGGKPKEIRLIVSEDWKRSVNNALAADRNVGKLMESVKADKVAALGEAVTNIDIGMLMEYISGMAKKAVGLRQCEIDQKEEVELLNEAGEYIGNLLGVKVMVEKESETKSERAKRSMPEKPSIDAIV